MSSKQKQKILIVDDDKFLLDMYVTKFTQSGFDVVSSLGAAQALDKLKGGAAPNVILTDILMPEVDGFEFLQQIKKTGLVPAAKVVVLSNKGERSDIDRGVSLGADGYIIKASAIPSEVVAKVKEIIEKN